ncbi:MAG: HTH domain-containing protein, partial [Alkalibacterium sp.]|nr:HTH domain-containing protein [Alkalibacterium sp.]
MNLSERSRKIVMRLLSDNQVSSYGELSEEFNVSERAIRYDLDEIDAFLISKKLPPLTRQTKIEVSLDHVSSKIDKLRELTKEFDASIDYYLPHKRQHLIYITILLSQELVDINSLMEKLEVSRSTVVGDIRELRKVLKDEGVLIDYTSAKGYYLKADENKIRKLGTKILSSNQDERKLSLENLVADYLPDLESTLLSVIEQFISEVEQDISKSYSDVSFDHIVRGLIVTICRGRLGCHLGEKTDDQVISPEYKSIDAHISLLESECAVSLNRAERKAIEQFFLGSSLLKGDAFVDNNWIDLNLFIIDLLDELSRLLNLPLNQAEDLFTALALHLGPAINRVKNETPLKNEIIEYIQTQYSEVYSTVETVLNQLG